MASGEPKGKARWHWMPFNPLDWLGDTRCLTNRQKGIWIDLLCYMWREKKRGKITGTWDEIARMVGEPWLEAETEIKQIFRKNVLNLEEKHPKITIISRRMVRDEKTRESSKIRVYEHRKRSSNTNVTRVSQGYVRSHMLDVTSITTERGWFEIVWKGYPNKLGRKAAERHFLATVKTETDLAGIQEALKRYLASEVARKDGGRWIQNGSTWFNNWRDWLDYKGPGTTVPMAPDPKRIEEKNAELYRIAELDAERRRQAVKANAAKILGTALTGEE